MSEHPFVGEVKMIAGTFTPVGWALCDGQLLQVRDHDVLFSLIGTLYGGDGRTSFALPDLRGRVAIGQGQGSDLSDRPIGSYGGHEEVALVADNWPAHTHAWHATTAPPTSASPFDNMLATAAMYSTAAPDTALAPPSISSVGGGVSHRNVQPFLALNYVIALEGVCPSRT